MKVVLKYHGSKWRISECIVSQMPEHHFLLDKFLERFCNKQCSIKCRMRNCRKWQKKYYYCNKCATVVSLDNGGCSACESAMLYKVFVEMNRYE